MISYIGGKARISKWIVPFIPKDIETYVEPFSGMFWVFFKMDLSKYPNNFSRLRRRRLQNHVFLKDFCRGGGGGGGGGR